MCTNADKSEKSIDKITLHFDDGTERTVNKGFICGFVKDEIEGTATANMHMVNVSGAELETVVLVVLELGMKLGMFNDKEDAENEES